ncbi:Thymidylate kinase [Candidatus Magnetomorum sp. HK-1]|nr:Thymidylate kinase [Candidatus Magnetomorum sp. HK-1]
MFITFEGIEGSGKSTQAKLLMEWFKEKKLPCVLTREPGGTDIGKQIRSILLNPNHTDICPMTELLLYMADRAQHLSELIHPEMSAGKIILCDRFYDATTVYQGVARQIEMAVIYKLHNIVLSGLKPDMTLLFDLPVEAGLKRAWKRIKADQKEQNENRFEKESIEFHEKVRTGYLELAKNDLSRFFVINANQSEKAVFDDVIDIISKTLKR